MVPCGSSPAARLCLPKNEAPEEEADLGLCCNQMWDACCQRFEPRTQNTSLCRPCVLRELKQLRRLRQRQKTIGFMSKTTALHVHQALKYISLTSTARLRRETSQRNVLWRAWTYDDKLSFLYLNMDKVVKNSTPRKLAYIWRIVRFQMDAIKDANPFVQWCFHWRRRRYLRSLCVLRGAKCGKRPSEIQAALNLGVTTLRQNEGFCLHHTIEHIKQQH